MPGDQEGWGWSTDCHGNAVWGGFGCSRSRRWHTTVTRCLGRNAERVGWTVVGKDVPGWTEPRPRVWRSIAAPLAFLGGTGHSLGHKAVLIHSLEHHTDTSGAERHSYGAGFASFRIWLWFAIPATQQPTCAGQQSHQHHCLAAGWDWPLSVPFDQHAAFDPAWARAVPSKGDEAVVRQIWSCFRSCARP